MQSGEQSLGEITATVLVYAEKWVPNGQAKVIVCYTASDNTSRFLGLRDQDVILSSAIVNGMKYNRATPVFHQWRDSRGAVYGLQFSSQGDADQFGNAVNKAFDILSGAQRPPPPPVAAGRGGSAAPAVPPPRVPGPARPATAAPPPPPSMAAPAPPRGAPPPPAGGGPPPPPPGPAGGPPPPPPPPPPPSAPAPPSSNGGGDDDEDGGGGGLAAQLRAAKLKKVAKPKEPELTPAAPKAAASEAAESAAKAPTGGGGGGGGGDMMAELMKRQQARQKAANVPKPEATKLPPPEPVASRSVPEPVSRAPALPPAPAEDSHRKLSVIPSPAADINANYRSSELSSSSSVLSPEMEALKREIMVEVRREVDRAVQELTAFLRAELANR